MNRTSKSFFLKSAVVLALVGWVILPAISFATPINHGDFEGTTVWFKDVTEDANSTGDTPPLYGAPSVSGDTLDFNPVGFSASAANGTIDQTDGNLLLSIQAKPFKGVESILLSEAGDTSLGGFGTDNTYTEVRTHITVDILMTVPGGPVNINYQTDMIFSPSGGDFGLLTDGGGGPSFSTNWNGAVLIEIGAILAANGYANQTATRVDVNIDNVLLAISQTGTVATISKKDFDTSGLTVDVNIIPEPSTVLLALFGVVAGVCRRR